MDLKQEWILKIYLQESCIGSFWRSGAFNVKKHCLRIPLCQKPTPYRDSWLSGVFHVKKLYLSTPFSQKPSPYIDSWRSHNYPLQKIASKSMLLRNISAAVHSPFKNTAWRLGTSSCKYIHYIQYASLSQVPTQWNNTSNILRGVVTNSGLGGPGTNRDLFCIVSTNVVKKSLMFFRPVNNNVYTGMEVISLVPSWYCIRKQ